MMFTWLYGALAGALIGAAFSYLLLRQTMRHERSLALFQLELSQMLRLHEAISIATAAITVLGNLILDNNDSNFERRLIRWHSSKVVELERLLSPAPFTTEGHLSDLWSDYLDAFLDLRSCIIGEGASAKDVDSERVRQLISELELIQKKSLRQLKRALANFEKGKPMFER